MMGIHEDFSVGSCSRQKNILRFARSFGIFVVLEWNGVGDRERHLLGFPVGWDVTYLEVGLSPVGCQKGRQI